MDWNYFVIGTFVIVAAAIVGIVIHVIHDKNNKIHELTINAHQAALNISRLECELSTVKCDLERSRQDNKERLKMDQFKISICDKKLHDMEFTVSQLEAENTDLRQRLNRGCVSEPDTPIGVVDILGCGKACKTCTQFCASVQNVGIHDGLNKTIVKCEKYDTCVLAFDSAQKWKDWVIETGGAKQ